MKAINDQRFYEKPKILSDGESMILKFRGLNPGTFTMFYNLVLWPWISIWRFTAAMLIIDFGIELMTRHTLFAYMPCSRETFLIVMGAMLVLWQIEGATRYFTCRCLFGKFVRLTISPDYIVIKNTWFGSGKKFLRDCEMTFKLKPLVSSQMGVGYRSANRLMLEIHGSRYYPVTDLLDPKFAHRVAANVNSTLALQTERYDYDTDPLRGR